MVKSFIEVARENIHFNLQTILLGLYIVAIFIIWQMPSLQQMLQLTEGGAQIFFYLTLIISLLLILITHWNLGIYYGISMAFDRVPEQIIMISPKGQLISLVIDAALLSPFLIFKYLTENILAAYFNNTFLLITIFVIFAGFIIEIAVTDRIFAKYTDKIKMQEKVESDYTKIKTSLE